MRRVGNGRAFHSRRIRAEVGTGRSLDPGIDSRSDHAFTRRVVGADDLPHERADGFIVQMACGRRHRVHVGVCCRSPLGDDRGSCRVSRFPDFVDISDFFHPLPTDRSEIHRYVERDQTICTDHLLHVHCSPFPQDIAYRYSDDESDIDNLRCDRMYNVCFDDY